MAIALWVAACNLLLLWSSLSGVKAIGVTYGVMSGVIPSPDKMMALYKSRNITNVWIYHPEATILKALRGSGLGVALATFNDDLSPLASNASFAASWVESYVQPFAGTVRFRYITAGNEVIPGEAAALVLPAMQNLETALRCAGLSVPVTTAVEASFVLGSSYPSSQGAFSEAALPAVRPIVSFLASRSTPLLVNLYPDTAYLVDPSSAAVAVTDNGVEYANMFDKFDMFDAIVNAVYAAVVKTGGRESVELVVSKTVWPSGGGGHGTSVENTSAYVNNLVQHVGKIMERFIFAIFNVL